MWPHACRELMPDPCGADACASSNAHLSFRIPFCVSSSPLQEEYEAAKARDPDFYRGADSLHYGKTPDVGIMLLLEIETPN